MLSGGMGVGSALRLTLPPLSCLMALLSRESAGEGDAVCSRAHLETAELAFVTFSGPGSNSRDEPPRGERTQLTGARRRGEMRKHFTWCHKIRAGDLPFF